MPKPPRTTVLVEPIGDQANPKYGATADFCVSGSVKSRTPGRLAIAFRL